MCDQDGACSILGDSLGQYSTTLSRLIVKLKQNVSSMGRELSDGITEQPNMQLISLKIVQHLKLEMVDWTFN